MSNAERPQRTRILFFGTPGVFSRYLLQSLVRPDVELVGIVHRSRFGGTTNILRIEPKLGIHRPPLIGANTSLDGVPHYLVRNLSGDDVSSTIASLEPDLIVVGCFPLRLPKSIYGLLPYGAVNVHPSALPRHRGPDPIFWAFRNGDTDIGVSLHLIDEEFDSGAIVAQERMPLPARATFAEIEADLAQAGSSLLTRVIDARGRLEASRQATDNMSYESFALPSDLTIDRTWTIERASRFICGVGESHGPLGYISDGGGAVPIRRLATPPNGVAIELADGMLWTS